jgi:hypothetical protein
MKKELIETKYRRRLLIGSATVAIIALMSMRFFIIPYLTGQEMPSLSNILYSILDNLLVALIASITVTFLGIWLTPPGKETAVIETIEPSKIRETLNEAYRTTDEWWYRGAVGRHFRTVTLSTLADHARAERVTKKIYLLMVDPRKSDTYFEMSRARPKLSSSKLMSLQGLKEELYATLVSVYFKAAEEVLLEITVGLLDTVGVYRVDLSKEVALITTEGSQDFGLRCYSGSSFYKYYREDLNLSLRQANRLSIKGTINDVVPQLNVDNVEKLLKEQLVDENGSSVLPDNTSVSLKSIIDRVQKQKNPYAGF